MRHSHERIDRPTAHGLDPRSREWRREKAEDEAVEVGLVRTPVARIADERELAAAVDRDEEERAAADRVSRLRVIDPVLPDGPWILACEGMPWQNHSEEVAPARVAGAEVDPNRLRVERDDSGSQAGSSPA